MTRLDRFRFSALRAARRFAEAQDGAVAIILALALLPTLLLGGAAIDLRRVAAARSNLQATADSAALAGADALRYKRDPVAAATNYVNAAFDGSGVRPALASPPEVQGKSVTVKVTTSVPMTLMKLARFNEMPVKAEATATYDFGDVGIVDNTAEIVLVLDTTGSMSVEGRLDAVKTAAKDLIHKVMFQPDGSQNPSVFVGLVPFAQYVNVGLQYRNESWLTNTQDYSYPVRELCGTAYRTWDPGPIMRIEKKCWNPDETYRDCSYDQQTYINPRDPYQACSQFPAETHKWNGCVGSVSGFYYQGPGLPTYYYDEIVDVVPGGRYSSPKTNGIMDVECARPLVRLTSSLGEINSAIDALTPNGFTYIAPGALWGWRLLTAGQPFDDAKPAGQAEKSLVLMTDGANTRSPYYPDHSWTGVQTANSKTLAVCANAKAAGIQFYTIGFMAPEEVKPILRTCANTPANYYDAPSIPELRRAFNDIGARMTALRLIR